MLQDFAAIFADDESHTDNYKLLNIIGQENILKVKFAQHTLTGTDVVVTVIKSLDLLQPPGTFM